MTASHLTINSVQNNEYNNAILLLGLFNDAVSSSVHIQLNDTMINELERIWKEAVVA
jgi:hypothetical protein